MKDRALRDFTQEDLNQVTETFHSWQIGENYENIAGFVKSADLAVLQKHDFVLTPGRYVGAAAEEDDCEPFVEKMERLSGQLKKQFEESDRLESDIKKNLAVFGYDA